MSAADPHALDLASVQVTDLERTEAFYTDVLGFAVEDGVGPPHARVFKQARGAVFAIRTPMEGLDGPLGNGASLWFDVADVEKLYADVRAAGADVVQALEPGGFGPEFSVLDPGGYRLTSHENWE